MCVASVTGKEEADRPVSVSLKGARLYDALEEVSKALGRRVRLEGGLSPPGEAPRWPGREAGDDWAPGAYPRASTPNFDVVVEGVQFEWGAKGTILWRNGEPQLSGKTTRVAGNVRLYPLDLQAAERLVGLAPPGLVVVPPDGQEQQPVADYEYFWDDFSFPMPRCLLTLPAPLPNLLQAGEYKIRGAILVSKVAPVTIRFELPDAVGETQTVGDTNITVTSWDPVARRLKWTREGASVQPIRPTAKPRGVVWTELRATDAAGKAVWLAEAGGPAPGKTEMEATFGGDEPKVVELRMLIVARDEDVEEEPFVLSFRLQELAGR
jgi:hypothetical protein